MGAHISFNCTSAAVLQTVASRQPQCLGECRENLCVSGDGGLCNKLCQALLSMLSSILLAQNENKCWTVPNRKQFLIAVFVWERSICSSGVGSFVVMGACRDWKWTFFPLDFWMLQNTTEWKGVWWWALSLTGTLGLYFPCVLLARWKLYLAVHLDTVIETHYYEYWTQSVVL